MQRKKNPGKNIVESIKDNTLIPNVSLGQFVLGNNISDYLKNDTYIYEENPNKQDGYGFDSFYFVNQGLEVWTDNKGTIKCIKSTRVCYWKNVNIVGLPYKKFLSKFDLKPDSEDICYFSEGKMKTQHVYDFDSIGMQLWVWYGIVRTVIVNQLGILRD